MVSAIPSRIHILLPSKPIVQLFWMSSYEMNINNKLLYSYIFVKTFLYLLSLLFSPKDCSSFSLHQEHD